MDKLGNPICCQMLRAIPGNKPVEVYLLSVVWSQYNMIWYHMIVGCLSTLTSNINCILKLLYIVTATNFYLYFLLLILNLNFFFNLGYIYES